MNGRTNAKNGAGAIRDGCAVLEVKAPAWSQITAVRADGLTKRQSKGYVDLSDSDYWFYYIIIQKFELSNLEWTVTATDGTNTKSKSVEITTEGQSVNVKLVYWDGTLYNAGNQYSDITGGWEQTTSGSYFNYPLTGTVTFNADHIYLLNPSANKIPLANTKNKINFDGYSKLFVTFNSSSFANSRPCVMCVLSDVGGVAIEDVRIGTVNFTSGAGTVELDVSGIAEGHVAFYGTAGERTTAKITKVWLE